MARKEEPDYRRQMAKSNLSFDIKPPRCTEPQVITADELLKDIVQMRKRYDISPKKAQDYCKNDFAPVMAVEFVLNSNIGEKVGTQTFDGTWELLQPFLNKGDDDVQPGPIERQSWESINTYRALHKSFHDHTVGMKDAGLLTTNMICELHGVVLKGKDHAGSIRKTVVATNYPKVHTYPSPDCLEVKLQQIVDHHNIMMEQVDIQPLQELNVNKAAVIFKCAAWLMVSFVALHPFVDGNGRMCRILANYILSLITPFPVTVYHTGIAGRSRIDYIDAIVNCRQNPKDGGPCEMAYLLVEGAHRGWKMLFDDLNERSLLIERQILGPFVVKKSKMVLSEITSKVTAKTPTMTEAEVLSIVQREIESTDTTVITDGAVGEYISVQLDLTDRVCLQLEVFP